nr:PREDICTED: eukaryotic translation initiation factor 4E type 2-like [Lepisosteus oculatus]
MWEDEANKNGGKWIIRLRKGLASRFWENIILAMLGEQFMVGEEICGVVVSIRFQVGCPAGLSGLAQAGEEGSIPTAVCFSPRGRRLQTVLE